MENGSRLTRIRQIAERIIPNRDGRSQIDPLTFVVNLIFCFTGDTKKTSLESIRRQMKGDTKVPISRSAFWERLSGKRLKDFLLRLIVALMDQLSISSLLEKDTLT